MPGAVDIMTRRGRGISWDGGKISREGRRGWGICLVFCALFLFFREAVPASAVVRDARIEDVPGFRFENVVYNWSSIFIDVVNMTNRNESFGGTMIFLDRWGNIVARVRLLPQKIVRNSTRRYTGYCVSGTGEAARRAARVTWDFGAQ